MKNSVDRNSRHIHTSIQVLILFGLILFTLSCKNPEQARNAFHVFLIGVLQVINLVLFGVSSIVFSILGFSSGKHGYKIAGGILTGIFFLFTLFTFLGLQEWHPRHYDIYIIFAISLVIAITSLILVVKSPKHQVQNINSNVKHAEALDKIINEEDEII